MRFNLIWCIILLGLGPTVQAQFGLRAGASLYNLTDGQVSYSESGPQVAVNYWLRLKELRIEFYPEVSYSIFQHSQFAFPGDVTYKESRIGAAVITRLYPFDLKSDCNCPTFSKQNDFFKKGFFLSLITELQYAQTSDFGHRVEDFPTGVPDFASEEQLRVNLGIGGGVDIGISDLLTLSPYLNYIPSFDTTSDDRYQNHEIRAGLSLLFRPDY